MQGVGVEGGDRCQGVYVSRVGNETGVSRKWLGVQRTGVNGEAHGSPGHGPCGAQGVEWGRQGLEEAAGGRDVPTPAEGCGRVHGCQARLQGRSEGLAGRSLSQRPAPGISMDVTSREWPWWETLCSVPRHGLSIPPAGRAPIPLPSHQPPPFCWPVCLLRSDQSEGCSGRH